jgi:HSP20 family protein
MELERFGTAGDIQELLSIRDRIEGILDDHAGNSAVNPRADLLDTGDAYRLVLEVPGVSQENLEIGLQGQELIVAGLREPVDQEVDIIFSERASGHFQRSIHLPAEIDREAVTVHLREGLLILNLPKG